jgi:lambda family phage portal protein
VKSGNYTSTGFVPSAKLGYRAAKFAREQGVAVGGSGDYHLRYDRDVLVRQSQDFFRDNGLYEGIINRASDNILGEGFSLQARTSNADLNTQLESFWREFWIEGSPEVRGMDGGYDCERKALAHLWVDGDVGAIKTNLGLLQMIESERITSARSGMINQYRRMEDGVEMDLLGKPRRYMVADYDGNGYVQKNRLTPIDAENFLFLANRKRFSQTRGVPVLVSNFAMFHRLNDIFNSEAAAWQLLSRLAVAVTKKDAESKAVQLSESSAAAAGETPAVRDIADRVQDMDYAMVFWGEKDEDIRGIDRNIPGPNFTASVTMFLRLIGLPVGFPLELILLDWSKTNYSSARAALEQAFRMFQAWQRRLKNGFHSQVYRWKVGQWVAEGRVQNASDIFAHEFVAPGFPWIDQLKEAQAWGERIDRGMATLSQACKSLNQDREDWLMARKREVNEAIAAADEINQKNPDAKVPWQMFAGTLAPKETPPRTVAEKSEPKDTEDDQDAGEKGDKNSAENTGVA